MSQILEPSCVCFVVVKPDPVLPHGRVLAAFRKHDPEACGFPGGKREPGETALEAALRELREEGGEDLVIQTAASLYVGFEGDGKTITETFLACVWSGEPRQRPGEGRIGWVTWEEIIHKGPFTAYNQRIFEEYTRVRDTDKDDWPRLISIPIRRGCP
jgi:ADP-ribose pyrophosphatase YjhB (NUDIX family)